MYYCELFVTRLVVDRDKPGNLLLFGLLFVVFYGLRISQDFQLDQFYYHSESQNNLSLEMFSLNMVDNCRQPHFLSLAIKSTSKILNIYTQPHGLKIEMLSSENNGQIQNRAALSLGKLRPLLLITF